MRTKRPTYDFSNSRAFHAELRRQKEKAKDDGNSDLAWILSESGSVIRYLENKMCVGAVLAAVLGHLAESFRMGLGPFGASDKMPKEAQECITNIARIRRAPPEWLGGVLYTILNAPRKPSDEPSQPDTAPADDK